MYFLKSNQTNTTLLTTILFGLTSLIYIGKATYSYFYKIESEVIMNITLGIMLSLD